MMHRVRCAFLIIVVVSAHYCEAQSAVGDTTQAELLVRMATEYNVNIEYDSSIICLQKAKTIFLEVQDWEQYVHCLNIIADCLLNKVAIDSADTVLRQALEVEKEQLKPDDLEFALTYSLAGLISIYRDNFDDAIKYINLGKAIRERMLGDNHKYVAASNYLLGFTYLRKGEFESALDYFNKALNVYTKVNDNDHYNLCLTFLGIGYVSLLRSDFDIALGYFSRAFACASDNDRKYLSVIARCHEYFGWAFLEKGKCNEAISHLTIATNLYHRLFGEENPFLARCYADLARVWQTEGDMDQAIEYYQKAISLDKKFSGNNHLFEALETRQLGLAYADKNDLDLALLYSKEALTIQQKASGNEHPELAYTYEILANIYKKRRQYDRSLRNLRKALELRSQLRESADRNDIANLYLDIGSVYSEERQFDRALLYLNRALLLQNALPDPNRPQRAATLKGIGDVYLRLNKPLLALRYYQRSMIALLPEFADSSIYANPDGANISSSKELIEILASKATGLEEYYSIMSHDLKDLQFALATYDRAAAVLSALRKKLTTEGSKLFLEEQCCAIHENAIRLSLKLFNTTSEICYKESAFHFAENNKANVLLDGLHDSEAKRFANIPDSIIEKEKELKIEIVSNETLLQKDNSRNGIKDSAQILMLQDKCFALNNEEHKLAAFLENKYPLYYELKYNDHTATINEIQKRIDEKTGIIEYSTGQRSFTIFLITKSSFDVFTIPRPSAFGSLACSFYRAIKKIEEQEYVRTGISLYNLLFRPLEEKLRHKSRLLIIPDVILYYLPFEALIMRTPLNSKNPVDFSHVEYLIKRFEISYSYSCSFYLNRLQQKETVTADSMSFVGFAPVFRDADSNGLCLSSNAVALEKDLAALRSVTIDGKRFCELKYSEKEVTMAAEDFQKKGRPGTSFLYDNASEEQFKSNIGRYSCVHIATHGYINEAHPELSMLLFSQPHDSSAAEDGVLYASETYNLNLNANLLVLSSCDSGLGKFVKGEGVMAMTRGFFYSGAQNIIFSLWKVYDKPTNELMRGFYGNVLEGETFSSALRNSKLRLIADKTTAFPSKWSGFVLVGN